MQIFDAHLHIIDPSLPLIASEGFRPPPFSASTYLDRVSPLGITGGAVVAGSFHGFDPTPILAALRQLGPAYVGVAQLSTGTTDARIRDLATAGVRAVRCNLRRGPCPARRDLVAFAARVRRVAGWHLELYVDATELPGLATLFDELPSLCLDHLGLSRRGLPHLLRRVERGAKVKASGFARLDFPPAEAIRTIVAIDPTALIFGTDLPGTRAPRPFEPADLELICDAIGDAETLRRVLHDNACELYRPMRSPSAGRNG